MFAGVSYSLKFYEKLPEFKQHDRKEMLKAKTDLAWINHCEDLADGVLRTEATLRRKYLKRQGIYTVDDLTRSIQQYEWLEGAMPESEEDQIATIYTAVSLRLIERGVDINAVINGTSNSATPLEDGMEFPVPPFQLDVNGVFYERAEPTTLTFRRRDNLVAILQYFLTKFVGDQAGMQTVDEVQLKLMEVYKPVKAARLVSIWLYVQRFSSAEAREIFGRQSFDYSKREMKKAGVTLIEPPNAKSITVIERDFFQNFKLEVPSEHVTNKEDDFRNGGNILNFVPKMSGYDERAKRR